MSAVAVEPGSGLVLAWQRMVAAGLFGLGLFLPYSTAGVSLFSLLLLVLLLLRPSVLWREQPWRQPALAAGLALLGWIALHTLWRNGWSPESGATINRYHELLGAPLLYALLGDGRRRRMLLVGFVAGVAGLAVAYWAVTVAPSGLSDLAANLSQRRISAGYALSTGAFLVAVQAHGKRSKALAVLAATLAATVLFALDGRTGQVVLLVLAGLAAWVMAPRRARFAMAAAVPIIVLALAMVLSPNVKSRLPEVLHGAGPDAAGSFSSTAIRIEFARLAVDLAREHGIVGAGYANYSQVHEQAAQARYGSNPATASWMQQEWIRTPNPHNEYAMQVVSGGVVGIALYLVWLALAFRQSWRYGGVAGAMLAGAVVAYAVAGLFNSVLMDFVEGHVYMALLATLLAGTARPGAPRP